MDDRRDGIEERERLLAGFSAVDKGGMVLGIGQVHHGGGGRAEADNPFPNPKSGASDRERVQPFGRR